VPTARDKTEKSISKCVDKWGQEQEQPKIQVPTDGQPTEIARSHPGDPEVHLSAPLGN